MSEQSKRQVEEVKKMFQDFTKKSQEMQNVIPDKQLSEKIKKVSETSHEVVKHIEEKTGDNK